MPGINHNVNNIKKVISLDELDLALMFFRYFGINKKSSELDLIKISSDYSKYDDLNYQKAIKDEIGKKMREILRETRRRINNCKTLEEKFNIMGFSSIKYKSMIGKLMTENKKNEVQITKSLSKVVEDILSKIGIVSSNIEQILEKTPIIMNNELLNKIDPIKLGLLLSYKSMDDYETDEEFEDTHTYINISGMYAYYFYKYIINNSDILKIQNKIEINRIVNDKKVKYTLRDFIKTFEKYYLEKMASKMLMSYDKDIRHMTYKEYTDIFYKELDEKKKLYDLEEATVDWKIIRKGDLTREVNKVGRKVGKLQLTNSKQNSIEIKNLMNKCEYFDNTNYICSVQGINKMSGYIGYIYSNGCVVFDKFYEDEENQIPAKFKALYVMDINNFISLSRLTKPQIIDYIKNKNDKTVKRFYHTNTWQKRLDDYINSIKTTKSKEEVLSFISLLKDKVINDDNYSDIENKIYKKSIKK